MRITDALSVVLIGATALTLVTGCGQTVNGNPRSVGSRDDIKPFNPCWQLGDELLRGVGLDPATKRVITDPPSGPAAWRVCGWQPVVERQYLVYLFSTSHTIIEARANAKSIILRDVTIGGRRGLVGKAKSDTQGDGCYVSFPAVQGMFEVSIGWVGRGRKPDLCELAERYARALEPYLPK